MKTKEIKKKGPKNELEFLSTQVGKSHFIMDYRPLRHLNLSAKQHFMLIEILQWTLQGNKYKKAGSSAARDLGCKSEEGVYDVLKKLKKKNYISGTKIPNFNENGEPAGSKFIYEANLDEILKQVLATTHFQQVLETSPGLLPQLETMMKKKLELMEPEVPKEAPQSIPKDEDGLAATRAAVYAHDPSIIMEKEEDEQRGLISEEEKFLTESLTSNGEQETQSSTYKTIIHNDESSTQKEYPFVTDKIDPAKLLLRYIDAGETYNDLLEILEEWGIAHNWRQLNINKLNTFLTEILKYDNLTDSMTNDVHSIIEGIKEDRMKTI